MNYYDVFLLESVAAYDGLYTYRSERLFQKGDVVAVPFGAANLRKEALVYSRSEPREHIKNIVSEGPMSSISPERVDLLLELSDYYLIPRGDMLRLALPKLVRKESKAVLERTGKPIPETILPELETVLKVGGEVPPVWLRAGYLFRRGAREAFFLSTTLDKEQLREYIDTIPERFRARRRILEEMLQAYPESILASSIPVTQRRFFSEQGFFRFALTKQTFPLTPPDPLTQEQEKVFRAIEESEEALHLIWGVCASGKSHLFLHLVQAALQRETRVLVLFPDNRVLQAALPIYQKHFGEQVTTYQGRMTPAQLSKTLSDWEEDRATILLGTRGSLLLPLKDLGLILMDECQEDEYLSDYPAYDARNAAVLSGRRLGIKVVFASSTPPVELLFTSGLQRHLLRTPFLPHAGPVPEAAPFPSASSLSEKARENMANSLERNEKIALLSTRSGYASNVYCSHCGAIRHCQTCGRSLLYYRARALLQCQTCSISYDLDSACPVCGQSGLSFGGRGIEKTEEELREIFPKARILRMDFSTSRGSKDFEKWEERLGEGEFDILLGNKLITRGYEGDFSLAVALEAEGTLYLPEHRSGIKTFSRLYQFFGRAGRTGPARAILQTRSTDNYVISALLRGDLWGFYDEEIRLRREQNLPPFSSEILLRFQDRDRDKALRDAAEVAQCLRSAYPSLSVVSYEPIHALRRGVYEHRILLTFQEEARPDSQFLLALTKKISTLRFRVDPEYILY